MTGHGVGYKGLLYPDDPRWVYDDGGRAAAGFKGETGDCVTRAITIATGASYRSIYNALKQASGLSPRDGMERSIYQPFLAYMGWSWQPTMQIGSGTTVHLKADELPGGRLIVRVSKHMCAVIDGVIHDIDDPSRGGTRAVYGFFYKGAANG